MHRHSSPQEVLRADVSTSSVSAGYPGREKGGNIYTAFLGVDLSTSSLPGIQELETKEKTVFVDG
jgi:hypothetical protein